MVDPALLSDLAPATVLLLQQTPKLEQECLRVFACSDFCRQFATTQADDFKILLDLVADNPRQHFHTLIGSRLQACEDFHSLQQQARLLRNLIMAWIAWRDLCGYSDFKETAATLSQFADNIITAVYEKLYAWHCQRYGTPQNARQQAQPLLILALGKLGSQELNFSSDVDLIFTYPDAGQTDSDTPISNEEFFIKLGQQLIKALHSVTHEGFVFRVDMRLRPFGDSGSLVMNFNAMAMYYQEQGRDWERYALIKARALNGTSQHVARLYAFLRPFIYRRYVDYGSITALREMKKLIQREVHTKNLQHDLKRGPGGIREIEFITHAFQLIRGGHERQLQQRNLLNVLQYLGETNTFSRETVAQLQRAYILFRDTEHCLQMVADQQTHTLPQNDDARERLAKAMNYDEPDALFAAINEARDFVSQHFSNMLQEPTVEDWQHEEFGRQDLINLWQTQLTARVSLRLLRSLGFRKPEQASTLLQRLRDTQRYQHLQSKAKDRLDKLIPILLPIIASQENPEETLQRFIDLLDAIMRRSVYVALLLENMRSLPWLVHLFSASRWVAEQICLYPLLLDEVISTRLLTQAESQQSLDDECRQSLLSIPEHDLEAQMDALRIFKLRQVLRVAAADIDDCLSLMKVSDHLTFTANTIIRHVYEIALKDCLSKFTADETSNVDLRFLIIAYGKLGGIELSYSSDLDLVFLHDNDLAHEPLTLRLAKRIIHMLTIRTTAGVLYKVDTRLRPSGSAGLMVSSMDAFANYQQQSAWTWEHQALIRARVVCGPADLTAQFAQIRQQVLSQPRDVNELRHEVSSMREKMQQTHEIKKAGFFDVKQGPGGIADIEFFTQFCVLAWAADHPALLQWTDNIRIFETLVSEGLLTSEQALPLIEAYIALRQVVHHATLEEREALVADTELLDYRQHVLSLWQQFIAG